MDRDFWFSTWQNGQIGFHLSTVNPQLVAHHKVLHGQRIFVPLCGKSLDLAWLAGQGHQVVGVELSELAVSAFFREQKLTPTVQQAGKLTRYQDGNITLYCGDLFELTPDMLGPVDGYYDRAALVALPPDMRRRYAAHVQALVSPPATGLLVTFEYPPHEMSGPPFSVDEQEVRALFEPAFTVQVLSARSILDDEPRFRERGLSVLHERVLKLQRQTSAPRS